MDIYSVIARYEKQLMRLTNVNGVGIGANGDKEVIKVFVTKKLSTCNLQPHEIIPKELEGYETDVEEIGVVTTQL